MLLTCEAVMDNVTLAKKLAELVVEYGYEEVLYELWRLSTKDIQSTGVVSTGLSQALVVALGEASILRRRR